MSKFGQFFGFWSKNSFKLFKPVFLFNGNCRGNFASTFSYGNDAFSA